MYDKNKTQNIIDRYVYDVVRRLPKDQREDIELEIRDLIDDMINESGDNDIEKVLKKLGTPKELEKKYGDKERYLIGAEYFESYSLVLKIVLVSVFISVFVSSIINVAIDISLESIIISIGSEIFSGIFSMIFSFGFVTLIFAILEREKLKFDIDFEEDWSPSELPEVPDKKVLIKRSETIASIIFIIIFMGLLIFAPRLFGAWLNEGGHMKSIPIFNLDIWNVTMPLFVISLGIGLIDEIIKLVIGRYCIRVVISNVISGALQLIISIILLKVLPLWNENFIIDIKEAFNISNLSLSEDIIFYLNTESLSNLVLVTIVFITILEIGTTIYKTIRYGK